MTNTGLRLKNYMIQSVTILIPKQLKPKDRFILSGAGHSGWMITGELKKQRWRWKNN